MAASAFQTTITYDEVIPKFVKEFPELESVLAEHLHNNYQGLLPHVFVGDVTRYVATRAEGEWNADTQRWLKRLAEFLEMVILSNDEKARSLVIASFLENLNPGGISFSRITSQFGPHLSEALQKISV